MSSMQASNPVSTPTRAANDRLLRLVLKLDAVVTAVNGVAYLALAGVLNDLFGYPTGVQYEVGAFLLVYGIAVWVTATRPVVSRGATKLWIAVNVLWVVLSLVVVATGAIEATTLGKVWMVLQAVVVGAFAALQAYALGKADRA
ncbi:hypothetical protein [Micromonospora mirobrigensis]|uniref:Integral membrane protein n=1 Tax=Micromonospora mirobrigensis TaxID=262898 RepID=A0A1C4ZZ85_9ACTN|nr:hypothetical protein [Micromonospora mirobrigensis]SCF38253.1 hypothetical protein GA0070564_10766 [Micromonospora mirobrigensis]